MRSYIGNSLQLKLFCDRTFILYCKCIRFLTRLIIAITGEQNRASAHDRVKTDTNPGIRERQQRVYGGDRKDRDKGRRRGIRT